MVYNKQSIHFVLKPSKILSYLIGSLYGLGGIVLYHLPISLFFRKLVILLHGIYGYLVWYHSISLQSSSAIVYLQYDEDKGWCLGDGNGEIHPSTLQPGSLCTYQVTILHFRCLEHEVNHCVLLFPDSLSEDQYRRLRQRLHRYL